MEQWSDFSGQVCQGVQIHRMLLTQNSDSALPCVYEWIDNFKSGRISVARKGGRGGTSTSTTNEKIQYAWNMLMVNWQVIIDKAVCPLQIQFPVLLFLWAHLLTERPYLHCLTVERKLAHSSSYFNHITNYKHTLCGSQYDKCKR